MKYSCSILILLFLISGCRNQCNEKIISKGKIYGNWEYKNDELGFKLKLPNDWFMLNQNSTKAFSMKGIVPKGILGNDTIKLKSKFDIRRGGLDISPILKISDSDIKKRAYPEEVILTGEISFAIIRSKNQNENKDIEDLKKEFQTLFSQNKNELKLNKSNLRNQTFMKFGNSQIPSLVTRYQNSNGLIQTQIAGIKNYGCYNLIIIASYQNNDDFKKITKILSRIEH